MKKIIKFESTFYNKEFIEDALEEFEGICRGKFLDDFYSVELEINVDYEIDEVIGEFKNYVLSLMKSNFKIKSNKEKLNEINIKNFTLNNDSYDYNFYRYKEINNKFLLTTETGDFIFLNQEEFNIFKLKKFKNNIKLLEKLIAKNFIFKNRNFSKLVKKKREKLAFLFQGPSLHIVVLTLRCNLRCSYCHASSVPINKEGFDMTEDIARKTINKIFESPSNSITIEFQGGEPLLNFEIIKYMVLYSLEKNKILKKDLKFALVSNFVYMTEEILDFLIKNNVGICTSLDGPKEIHNKNRQEYDKTVYWIKRINEVYLERNKKNRVNALPVITKHSLSYHKEIVDEYLRLGLNSIFLRQLNPLGFAKIEKDIFYSAKEYVEFWKLLIDYLLKLNKDAIKIYDNFTKILLQKIFLDVDPNYCELRSPCGAVNGQLLYNYDGKIYSCDEGRMLRDDMFKLGTVDDSYEQITTSPTACSIIASSINDVHYCDKCVYKTYCGICPVLNYSMSNSIISNINSQDRCKILKAQFDYIFEKLESDEDTKEIFLSWI